MNKHVTNDELKIEGVLYWRNYRKYKRYANDGTEGFWRHVRDHYNNAKDNNPFEQNGVIPNRAGDVYVTRKSAKYSFEVRPEPDTGYDRKFYYFHFFKWRGEHIAKVVHSNALFTAIIEAELTPRFETVIEGELV